MKYLSAKREFRPTNDAPPIVAAACRYTIRDGILLGLVLFTLVRNSAAQAGDGASPGRFDAPVVDEPAFSATEFRPHKHTVFDSDPTITSFRDTPMLRGTTVWQRLTEYKSRDRVRLLTLWETRDSTVSLQAGKHGDPSLQWTSRLMSRGESTQGLLDRWFSVSLAHAGNSFRNMGRPLVPAPAPSAAPAQISGLAVASLK